MKCRKSLYMFFIILSFCLPYSIFFLFDFKTISMLAKEDGFFEYVTAICFFCVSVLLAFKYYKESSGNNFVFFKTRKNLFFLLLSFVFFIGAGEEISWGQRILNIQSPKIIQEINQQKEINLHNLRLFHHNELKDSKISKYTPLLNIDRLFSLFWFTYCFLIPFLKKFNQPFSNWLKKINLPTSPISFGVFFIANYAISKVLELYFHIQHFTVSGKICSCVTEVKECNFSVLFLLLSIYLYRNVATNFVFHDNRSFHISVLGDYIRSTHHY